MTERTTENDPRSEVKELMTLKIRRDVLHEVGSVEKFCVKLKWNFMPLFHQVNK